MSNTIKLCAEVDLQCGSAPDRQPRISILAYSGGVIRPAGWPDLAIDVAGVSAAGQLPLLLDHDATTAGVVGHGVATLSNGTIEVHGHLIAGLDATNKLLALHNGGLALQASIGIDPTKQTRLKPGEKLSINKHTITAGDRGLTVIAAGILREVSILPVAADGTTSVSIAAKKGEHMLENESEQVVTTDEAVLTAERERVAGIVEVCGGNTKIASQAIKAGWDRDRAELECRRQARPTPPAIRTPFDTSEPKHVLAASLLCRMGFEGLAVKTHGEQTVEAARRSRGMVSLVDMCHAALVAEHRDVPSDRGGLIKAAFSTVSLPSAISDAVHTAVKMQYTNLPQSWRSFAAVKSAADFRTHSLLQANLGTGLDPVSVTGDVHFAALDTTTYTFSVATFAKQFRVTRRDVINDHVGMLADVPNIFARQASRRLADLVATTLLANTGSHFGTGNLNYMSGGASALSVSSLATALQKMRIQQDSADNNLDIQPAVLLVPPELEVTALGLLESEYIASFVDGTTINRPTGNPHKARLELQVEPRLSNTDKFAGASTTGWYVLAGPIDTPFVVAFLDGVEVPQVEFFGFDSDPNNLGISWRVVHDFGAALGDPKAGVLSAGA